jgi:hypothetical protein
VGLLAYAKRSRIASALSAARPLSSVSIPAPMGSINTISAGGDFPAGDCILRFNLIPAEYGLRVRLGSKEWCTGLTGGAVRCVMPFTAQVSASNKVFATTSTGIWDVTASSTTPTQVVAFGASDSQSGYGAYAVMVTSAGHFLVYTDETNGAYIYTETSGAWTTLSVTGVSAANLVHVASWKNRLWFTERGTGSGWFLGLNSISGAATSQNFGARFKSGGELVGLYNWTRDGASGMDDMLVAISSGGDVLAYQGTDPTSASTFGLKAVWNIGAMPAGRAIASDVGGDLLIAARSGLVSMNEILAGGSPQYVTAKVQNLWNKWMLTRASYRGWQMVQSPEDATLIVLAPNGEAAPSDQFVMSLHSRVWSQYRDLQMGVCAASYAGKVWYGTIDGTIRIMDGYTDGRSLADPTTTEPITYSLLTAFSDLGTPNVKRLHMVRPTFVSETASPTYSVQARYGWNLAEADAPTASAAVGPSDWDTAVWDVALWGEDYSPTQNVNGLVGSGSICAIAIKGESSTRTILTGFIPYWDTGGAL